VTGLSPVKYDNKKSLYLLFHFYCLSIELREDEHKLVSEFCLLNTDLGYEAFDSGRSTAFLRAHSFLMLHDEDAKTKSKKVLLGNQEDQNVIISNEDFYIKRPIELRKKLMKGDGKEMDPQQLKIKLSVQIPSPKQTMGEMLVNIELREIKVFLRLNVFNELSKFTITGLDRLNRQAKYE